MVVLIHVAYVLEKTFLSCKTCVLSYCLILNNKIYYYIRLYFTVFLLARSNTRDIPFSNILISKKQFLCNK